MHMTLALYYRNYYQAYKLLEAQTCARFIDTD